MLDSCWRGRGWRGRGGWGLDPPWLPYQGGSGPSQGGAPSQETRQAPGPVMCFTLKLEDTDSLAMT